VPDLRYKVRKQTADVPNHNAPFFSQNAPTQPTGPTTKPSPHSPPGERGAPRSPIARRSRL